MRRNSLHRVRKRGVTRLRNRSNATKTEREGVENFSYLAKDVACRLFALVFCTKFHLLQIPYTSTAWVLTSLRLLMFGLVCIKKNPPLQLISLARRRWFLYDRDVFDALLRPWIILFYKPRVFWFLRIGKQFGDNKKTRSGRNLMLVRSTCRLISTNVNFTFNVTTSHNNRFFTNLDPISFPANTRRSKYDYQLGVSCHSSTSSRTNGKCKRH